MPKISIITVVYNGELFIEKTINSVLNQEFLNYEYLIVDGGSTDSTLSIIDQYKERINLIISEPDKGIYDAMNKGAQLAKGSYVYFLNAGDIVFSDTFTKIFQTIDIEADIIYGNTINASTGSIVKALNLKYVKYEMAFCHQSVLVKRELQQRFPFDIQYKICGDFDFFLNMYYLGKSFYYVNVSFGEYDDTGISNTNFGQAIFEYLKVIWRSSKGGNKLLNPFLFLFRKRKFITYLVLLRIMGKNNYNRIKSIVR